METSKHFENCSAPLCADGVNQDEALWFIGEEICTKPSVFKTKQRELNRKLKIGYPLDLTRGYTISELLPRTSLLKRHRRKRA